MQEKKIKRSNSFVVNAFKWFPHYSNYQNASSLKQFGSTVAVQKLRESKWFEPAERAIFCAVVECGFIVEIDKTINTMNTNRLRYNSKEDYEAINDNDYEYDLNIDNNNSCEQDGLNRLNSISSCGSTDITVDNIHSIFGIVICKTNSDNKPKIETIEIFSVKIRANSVRIFKLTLDDIWTNNWKVRINNFADREKECHTEKDIKNQVSFARKTKYSLWHNSKHFAYWCRYGSRQQDIRRRQMSECVKWSSVGMNAGMLMLMNNKKSKSSI